jgi:hypothetical protein
LRHQNLNLACLPIPPRPREQLAERRDRERGALAQGDTCDKAAGPLCSRWMGHGVGIGPPDLIRRGGGMDNSIIHPY